LNASGSALNPGSTGLYVNPIRQLGTTTTPLNNYMTYNATSSEVSYATGPDVILWTFGTQNSANIPIGSFGNIDLTTYDIQYTIEIIMTAAITISPGYFLSMGLNSIAIPLSDTDLVNTVWTNTIRTADTTATTLTQSFKGFPCGYVSQLNTGQSRVILNGVISRSNLFIMNKFESQFIVLTTTAPVKIVVPSLSFNEQQNIVGTAFWSTTAITSISSMQIIGAVNISSLNYRISRIRKS